MICAKEQIVMDKIQSLNLATVESQFTRVA